MINNKVCVVIGGTDAVCAWSAKEMAKNGYVTAVIDKDIDAAKRISDEICTFGGLAKAYQAYNSDYDNLRRVQDEISAEFGKCNVIVNCIQQTEDVEGQLSNILCGIKIFVNDMINELGCSIINICPNRCIANPRLEDAITSMTKDMAISLAQKGIRANAIIYGAICTKTNRVEHFDEDNAPTEKTQMLIKNIPMNRLGKPEEIMGALKYLSDPIAAAYTTGTIIHIDGGYFANTNKI
ncbi:MAG: SDR family oxidoreductase [Ruminococcaceae bacterium]|nr:SDR family oxidoreductase [Oscillospiraceae bacterium]